MVAMSFTLAALPAQAADRWEEAAGGAVAILPAPTPATGITGGSLYCAEQKWGFLFRTDGIADLAGPVRIGLEGRTLTLDAVVSGNTLQVAVPSDVLEPLKTGSRIKVTAGGEKPTAQAIFNLRNSNKVIDAIAPRCTQIDMSAFQAVSLTETGPDVDAVTALFEDEIKLYRAATTNPLTVTAARIDRSDGKRMLFGSLCGSTWYYGSSGCTLSGWISSGTADWQQVYATEGVRLYLDEAGARDGWPGLASLPMVNGTEAIRWSWNGSAYEAQSGELLAKDETLDQGVTGQ